VNLARIDTSHKLEQQPYRSTSAARSQVLPDGMLLLMPWLQFLSDKPPYGQVLVPFSPCGTGCGHARKLSVIQGRVSSSYTLLQEIMPIRHRTCRKTTGHPTCRWVSKQTAQVLMYHSLPIISPPTNCLHAQIVVQCSMAQYYVVVATYYMYSSYCHKTYLDAMTSSLIPRPTRYPTKRSGAFHSGFGYYLEFS